MNIIRFAKRCYIGTSALLLVLGAAFLFWPGTSLAVLSRLVGAALALFGAARIIGYFSNDPYRLAFQFDFAMGILTCALGLVLLIFPGAIMKYMTALIGLFVVIDAVLTVQNALEARRFGLNRWWLLLLGGIVTLALVVCALVRPFETGMLVLRLCGAALLSDAVLNIITAIVAVHYERKG